MIVRILGEGQRRVPDSEVEALNALDDTLVAALEADGGPAVALEVGAQIVDGAAVHHRSSVSSRCLPSASRRSFQSVR